MLVVLAKLGTPEKVGQFALGLAVTAPIIMLTNLQLRAIQATDARHDYQFGDYLALRLIMTLVAITVITGVAFLSGYAPETALIILAIGVGKCFDAISDVFYGFLQQNERMDRISRSLIAKGVLSLILLAGAMLLTGSVLWASVAWSGASLIILLSYDLRSRPVWVVRQGEPRYRPDRTTLWTLTRLAFPLGVTMMLISLNANVPRYFLERQGGEYAVGIYSSMAYLMVVGTTLVGALGQSASPRLARYFAVGDRSAFIQLIRKLFWIALALGLAGVVGAVVVGRPLLNLLYGPEYAEASHVFVWIMAAAAVGYVASFAGYGVTAARQFVWQPVIFTISTVATVLACWLLVPQYGLLGTGWATLAAAALQCALMIVYLWRVLGAQPVMEI